MQLVKGYNKMSLKVGFSGMKKAPAIRPLLNIGCLFDIQTGRYFKGKHGEHILNGGLAHLTGIGGRGNTYKSTLGHFMGLRTLDRYGHSAFNVFDTENSATSERFVDLSRGMDHIDEEVIMDSGRFILTDQATQAGEQWFNELRTHCKEKQVDKNAIATSPFLNRQGEKIKAHYPTVAEVDSLSRMSIKSVEDMLEKNSIGDSANNTEALAGAKGKHQMLVQTPNLSSGSNTYMVFTAHVDDAIHLDPYAPKPDKLAYLKNSLKFKYVPNQYFFLMNNLWYVYSAKPFLNSITKGAEFPYSPESNKEQTNDLMVLLLQNLRGKYGASGNLYKYLVSQREGLLVGLTEFMFLKEHGRFGLGGSDRNYYVELCPDIALQRTTVRQKIRENPKLQRALEISSEMCQMQLLWADTLPEEHKVSAQTLYDDIKKLGYDWDMILSETRGYWTFDEDNDPKKFLSTMDLLEMRAGRYTPYWYKK